MFDQFKEKIHSVQLDLNAGLKSLSEKAREVGRSKKLPGELHVLDSKTADLSALKPECVDAGDEILNRFQQMWTQLHINIEFSADKAAKTDKVIQELAEQHDKQVLLWKQLQSRLKEVPEMVTHVQNLAVTLGKLEADFEEIESMLKSLEDTCEEEELLGNKKIQLAELMKYKEQKSKERRQRRERLLDEYNQKFRRIEDLEDAKKKERQKAFQEVFAADMAHYRTHGKMTAPVTQSSQDLENRLDDLAIDIGRDDQQALDDFLGPDDDEDDDEEEEDRGRSSARKKGISKKKDESSGDEDEDGDDEEEGQEENGEDDETAVKTTVDMTDETQRIEGGQNEGKETHQERSDSVPQQDTEVGSSLEGSTVGQTPVEQSDRDGTTISDDKHQLQENPATEEKESFQEDNEGEDDEEEEEEDFGTPDEDADQSTTNS